MEGYPVTAHWLYDVFLSHNSADKEAVETLARRLAQEADLHPFLDKWHLIPGNPWQEELEQALDTSRTCAVFLGPHGIGSWENEEMRTALDKRLRSQGFRVIPVLLPGATMPERGQLPSFLSRLTWVDFRTPARVEDIDQFRRLVAGIRGEQPGLGVPGFHAALPPESPYRGLAVFDEVHAHLFFGREADTQHLLEKLRTQRFLAVVGASGSGKSSVVRAGVLPRLRQGVLPFSDQWTYLVCKPGVHPLDALAVSLAQVKQHDNIDSLRQSLGASERELHLQTRLLLHAQPAEARVCLVIDQFEELFTLCHTPTERLQFIAALRYAATVAAGQTVIILTMRADFVARAAEHTALAELLSNHQFLLGPMGREDLRQAIEQPAQQVGRRLEDGLADVILNDVGREPGLLPLMEDTLLQLWEQQRVDNIMTLQAYQEMGGVHGALAKKAEALFATLSPPQQTMTRRVFLRLTQPGEGTEDTRRRATMGELQTKAEETAAVAEVVQQLADARLLVTDTADQVDVAHEALMRGWPRLRGWIEEDRNALRTQRRITDAALAWQQLHRDEGGLFRGALLAQAHEWLENHAEEASPLEREFLEASLALKRREEQAEQERQERALAQARTLAQEQAGRATAERLRAEEQEEAARRAKRMVRLLLGAVLLLAGVGIFAGIKQREAQTQAHNAQVTLARNYWLIAIKAEERGDQLQALHAFARAAKEEPERAQLKGILLHLQQSLGFVLLGSQMIHPKSVIGSRFSHDERLILIWSQDGTARLWHSKDGTPATPSLKHEKPVEGATFNRDESLVLTWSGDGTARLWHSKDGTPATPPLKHERPWGGRRLTAMRVSC